MNENRMNQYMAALGPGRFLEESSSQDTYEEIVSVLDNISLKLGGGTPNPNLAAYVFKTDRNFGTQVGKKLNALHKAAQQLRDEIEKAV